jgi:hypothetical protein
MDWESYHISSGVNLGSHLFRHQSQKNPSPVKAGKMEGAKVPSKHQKHPMPKSASGLHILRRSCLQLKPLNSQLAIHRRQGQSLKSPLADAFPEVLHASCPRVQRAFSSSSSAFPQCNDLQRSHLAALDPFPSFLLHNYSPRHCPAPFNSRSMRCVGNGQGQLCQCGGRSCHVTITAVFFFFFGTRV